MQRAATLEAFLEDPIAHYLVGPTYAYFSLDRELFGFLIWGRPTGDDMASLARALVVELEDRVPPHRSLVDARRLELAGSDAFEALRSYIGHHHATLREKVTRLALIRPEGHAGAVVSGFYEVLDSPYPVKVFASARESLAWLGPPASAGFLAELEAIYAESTGTEPMLGALRTLLKSRFHQLTIEEASAALGISKRTLQRRLAENGTSFQEEINRERIREAEQRLLTSDAPITVIALDVGSPSLQHFSTLFRRITGESPSVWRARRRSGR